MNLLGQDREYFENLVAEAALRELGYAFVIDTLKRKNICILPKDVEYIVEQLGYDIEIYPRVLCFAYTEGVVFVETDDIKNIKRVCKDLNLD